MIMQITRAYVRTYHDSGQVTTYVEWIDNKGVKGRTEGQEYNMHMQALLARTQRESVAIERETW